MFDPDVLPVIKEAVRERARSDRRLLDDLCSEIRPLKSSVHKIQPRSTTSISLVASDGGNNSLMFDPFYVQLVRVVDSYGKELALDAISPTVDTDLLSAKQFSEDGKPVTSLGKLMNDLGVKTLNKLSPMIPDGKTCRETPERVSPSWVLVYRDLCEWAVLYERICYCSFATDTLIVRDGLLRSKLFNGTLFTQMGELINNKIEDIYRKDKRKVFLVGLAKHSKVLTRYRLAISLEDVFPSGEPRYFEIPRAIEAKAYVWPEYAKGEENSDDTKESPKFVLGTMHLVRFGSKNGDPIWAVDILTQQKNSSQEILGYLLADAIDGFPVPYYPRCLQKAHEHAEVVGFDLEILQDEIYNAVRSLLPDSKKDILEVFKLDPDPSNRRYE